MNNEVKKEIINTAIAGHCRTCGQPLLSAEAQEHYKLHFEQLGKKSHEKYPRTAAFYARFARKGVLARKRNKKAKRKLDRILQKRLQGVMPTEIVSVSANPPSSVSYSTASSCTESTPHTPAGTGAVAQ